MRGHLSHTACKVIALKGELAEMKKLQTQLESHAKEQEVRRVDNIGGASGNTDNTDDVGGGGGGGDVVMSEEN